MILKKSMELQGLQVDVSNRLADLLTKYAAILASQGNLEAAISYLGDSSDPQIAELRERLSYSVGRAHLVRNNTVDTCYLKVVKLHYKLFVLSTDDLASFKANAKRINTKSNHDDAAGIL